MQFRDILKNSYKNFHAKGLHYLCLQRTELVTVKAYFFEDTASKSPEVVVPHNHRYDFITEVITGELQDHTYQEVPVRGHDTHADVALYNKFNFYTPLNGGEGFVFCKPVVLKKRSITTRRAGETLGRSSEQIHTISVKPNTILLLTQLRDKNSIDVPSQAYSSADRELFPNTSGLYDGMDADTAIGYLEILQAYNVPLGHIQDGRKFPFRN
jgi:hypothetical protein